MAWPPNGFTDFVALNNQGFGTALHCRITDISVGIAVKAIPAFSPEEIHDAHQKNH